MPSQINLAVGDIVKLKSGGPEMTVESPPHPPVETCRCQWFAGKKLESGSFPPESLQLVKGRNPS
jgi:uncharacterized protein YodC (DUF2158 family)